jgi:TRAP-type mannitol/chloroaromatic compound transport system substrate-binding protein
LPAKVSEDSIVIFGSRNRCLIREMAMRRRAFVKGATVGLLGVSVASPAIAQANPKIRWRLAASWPKSLDTMYGSAVALCQRVQQLTDNNFEIAPFAAGEVVPALQVMDAAQTGSIECGHTLTAFYTGKNPAYAFDSGIAFGLNSRQQNSWMYHGGGLELIRDVFKKVGLISFPCGNVGVQMGGFYRKEINTVEDLKGLRFRIGGLGGTILSKLGVVAQQIPTGDIYSSLERGTIDAAEWIGPYDDEKLGLHKVAKYYYYPGWWEGSAQVSLLVNLQAWEALPPTYKAAFDVACVEQNLQMPANYDAKNPKALRRLIAGGAELKRFPPAVMAACYKAAFDTYDELAAKSEDFKKIYESWLPFLAESNLWFRVAENTLDNYRYSQQVPSK